MRSFSGLRVLPLAFPAISGINNLHSEVDAPLMETRNTAARRLLPPLTGDIALTVKTRFRDYQRDLSPPFGNSESADVSPFSICLSNVTNFQKDGQRTLVASPHPEGARNNDKELAASYMTISMSSDSVI